MMMMKRLKKQRSRPEDIASNRVEPRLGRLGCRNRWGMRVSHLDILRSLNARRGREIVLKTEVSKIEYERCQGGGRLLLTSCISANYRHLD